MKVIMMNHFAERLRKRFGLKKKSLNRHLSKVISNCSLALTKQLGNKFTTEYKNNIYVFQRKNWNIIFITVFQNKELSKRSYLTYLTTKLYTSNTN